MIRGTTAARNRCRLDREDDAGEGHRFGVGDLADDGEAADSLCLKIAKREDFTGLAAALLERILDDRSRPAIKDRAGIESYQSI